MASIVQEIEGVETCIRECEKKLDNIERSLRLAELSEQEIDDLISEEKQLQLELDNHRKDLRGLRKENFKSMLVSAAVVAALFGIYFVFWS